MKKLKQILLTILAVSMLASCQFISDTFKFKDTTEEFVETLLKEDYDRCVGYMAMEHEMAKNTNVDTMKLGFRKFRQQIVSSFGTELEYSFMSSEKKFSTTESESTPPNTTLIMVQFSNEKEFGVLKVLFDDTSKKILNINVLDIKKSIPSMILFWLFGLVALLVPVLNIYVIIQIKRSDLRRKWLKYAAVILLNVPALTYTAMGEFSFSLLSFQILLGISFVFTGYLNSAWAFGIPLGGLYWLWRIKQRPDPVIVQTDSETLDGEYKIT